MENRLRLDHVAWLVPALAAARERVVALGWDAEEPAEFPAEGTRESYVGPPDATARLLLVEPLSDAGPYAAALRARGPGLHHVALRTSDLEGYVEGLAGSGWLLLPQSLETIARARTVWLARPGVPLLVEVASGEPAAPDAAPVVEAVELPASARAFAAMLPKLAPAGWTLTGLEVGTGDRARLRLAGGGLWT